MPVPQSGQEPCGDPLQPSLLLCCSFLPLSASSLLHVLHCLTFRYREEEEVGESHPDMWAFDQGSGLSGRKIQLDSNPRLHYESSILSDLEVLRVPELS